MVGLTKSTRSSVWLVYLACLCCLDPCVQKTLESMFVQHQELKPEMRVQEGVLFLCVFFPHVAFRKATENRVGLK